MVSCALVSVRLTAVCMRCSSRSQIVCLFFEGVSLANVNGAVMPISSRVLTRESATYANDPLGITVE
ncbi:hypothetical protein PR003_g17897 [Phytophthora rubi]|uniref:Uncharacterized protein n=1 Tax=Phytophthora rubi TaxID=129364 RepID=A0A6A4EC86_9STRA|nr:hypothetical protein PR002_g17628 [Phytophthora rubi]KAE9006924.1 hypothetical protein PR001_g17085 [Phytophthora rubi]KAE9319747.1 hypothetical protein PR003_g17897 [Phytophthora rubi]